LAIINSDYRINSDHSVDRANIIHKNKYVAWQDKFRSKRVTLRHTDLSTSGLELSIRAIDWLFKTESLLSVSEKNWASGHHCWPIGISWRTIFWL